jgi:membrane-bound acyltransferase YfiQ involved in biofilm formation
MEPSNSTSASQQAATGKIQYINHIKVLLTILVVLHHAAITYGAPGDWYYQQKTTLLGVRFPMAVLTATDQSFFMGLFFFLSALFVEPSYQKKGAAKFLTDRLKRLGIPLVFYSLILSPVLNYMVEHYGHGYEGSFMEYVSGYHHWIDFGVLWFAAALLIFNLVYLLFKTAPALKINLNYNLPSTGQLLIAGFLLGLVSFLTRLLFPTGWSLSPLGFQLGYFPQYILLFIAGITASKNDWLNQLNLKQGKQMRNMAWVMVMVILPVIFILFLTLKFPGEYFNGGWNAISLSYSLWEQLTGVMIMVALLSISKFKWNSGSVTLTWMSNSAFGVYIFHPLVLIGLSLLVRNWAVDPSVKLIVVAPAAICLIFWLVSLIRKIKVVREII